MHNLKFVLAILILLHPALSLCKEKNASPTTAPTSYIDENGVLVQKPNPPKKPVGAEDKPEKPKKAQVVAPKPKPEYLEDWSISKKLLQPESVWLNSSTGDVYISNVNGSPTDRDQNGYIAKVDKDGEVDEPKWVGGLNGPKGMAEFKNKLYVADIDELVIIDIKAARVEKTIPVPTSIFLNDVALRTNGDVFISDTLQSKIYEVKAPLSASPHVSVFAQGKQLESPNGLLVDGDELVVASWGFTSDFSTEVQGRLYKLNLKTKMKQNITPAPLGNLDGLQKDKEGNFWVTDWAGGFLYKINPKTDEIKTAMKGLQGPADLFINPKTGAILVPQMGKNQATSYIFLPPEPASALSPFVGPLPLPAKKH